MKEQIFEIFKNLLKVKSIVTITLTIVFNYLAVTGVISGEQFIGIFNVVIAFYFGTQAQKAADAQDAKKKGQDK